MLDKQRFLLGGLVLSGSVFAQGAAPVVGTTAEVDGLVTMSAGTSVSKVAGSVDILDGSRFVTASTGTVTLKFADGCIVKLNPHQSFVVDNSKPCSVRIAAVQPVDTATAGGGATGGLGAGVVLGLGIAAFKSGGTAGGTPVAGGGGQGGGIPNLPPSGQ